MKSKLYVSKPSALLCAIGVLFCLWVHVGQVEEACFTAGCSLYQQTSVAGISLWVVGMVAFVVMGALSLFGKAHIAYWLAMIGVICDCFLLALLVLTAPCFFCMIFALILLCVYLTLRNSVQQRSWNHAERKYPALVYLWSVLFVCNVGIVVKTSIPLWDISDNVEDASVYMYFSPSCSVCKQGIEGLSGNIDVAFFPVAENSWDVKRVALMEKYLEQGMSVREAFHSANSATPPSGLELYMPSMLFLQLKLLFNKAHVFMQGGGKVPFLEYRGLPKHVLQKSAPQRPRYTERSGWKDPTLPLDSSVTGFCTGSKPCEDGGDALTPARQY
ncbi:hypothetical protein B5F76_10500 [Desulfovibrio sp. An276]|uniref:hypothetical protein n=1 Tax=Desulfovibrio sp. An276 TaxID=1965618 RepID=UPI000B374F4B|nr:hypothetical protein [Desulfovibrio sp. An276]OUO51027.1 hypothetical protein B5F76_10500 [Desulfovibrio sp. An276]